MKQRVRAFTILELTIAMLLSAVVIGIAYTTFSIISRLYGEYNRKHEELAVILRLDELLRRDFNHAQGVYLTTEGYTFKDSLQDVQYRFTPDYVLRSSSVTDTFKVVVQQPEAAFETQPVTEEVLVADSLESGRLDELHFTLLYKGTLFPCHYHKHYSSKNLINRK